MRPTSPVVATLRLLPGGGRGLCVALGALVLLTALLPAGFVVASGLLVGSIGQTVEEGCS